MIIAGNQTSDDANSFYQKTTLANGVRVVTSRMSHVHSASLIFLYTVGARYEQEHQAGVSHFIEHMLFKGTEKRPDPAIISGQIEGIGGIINASTGREGTNYWVKVPADHLESSFDVLADIVRNSLFLEEEMEKERFVIVEEIHGVNDTPDDLVHDLIDEVVWDGQPVGRSILGSVETVESLTADDLRNFMDQHYRPERMVIAAAGKVDHNQLVEMTDRAFGDLKPGIGDVCGLTSLNQTGPRVHLLERPTEQAHLCIGHPALAYTDDRRYIQGTIDSILSSGMSSRLFQEIRERRGLVYSVYGYFRQYVDVGQGVIYAGTDLMRVDETVSAIVAELQKLRDHGVPEDELLMTKAMSKGRISMGLEDSRSVASWIGGQELTFERIMTPEEVMIEIDKVKADDVVDLAREIYRADRLSLALIGPYTDNEHFLSLLTM